MNRLTGSLALLLAFVLALPSIAQAIQAAVPALLSLLLLLGIVRLALPPRRRGRR